MNKVDKGLFFTTSNKVIRLPKKFKFLAWIRIAILTIFQKLADCVDRQCCQCNSSNKFFLFLFQYSLFFLKNELLGFINFIHSLKKCFNSVKLIFSHLIFSSSYNQYLVKYFLLKKFISVLNQKECFNYSFKISVVILEVLQRFI